MLAPAYLDDRTPRASRTWWLWQEDLRWHLVDAIRCAPKCGRDAFGVWRRA